MWLDGPLISRSFHLCHTASGVRVYVCVFIYIYLFFFLWQPSAALRVELASVLWPGSCSCAASQEPGALVVEVVWGFDTGLPRGVHGFRLWERNWAVSPENWGGSGLAGFSVCSSVLFWDSTWSLPAAEARLLARAAGNKFARLARFTFLALCVWSSIEILH